MFDLSDEKNEWLVVELRLSRAILGISQNQLAEITGMAAQSIKRLEKKGSHPRYTSIIKLRRVFKDFGVNLAVEKNGGINCELEPDLVVAINKGELKEFVSARLRVLLNEEKKLPS